MMRSAPKLAKKCNRCGPLAEKAKLRSVARPERAAKRVAAVLIHRTQPRCSTNSTKIKTASSAKTNSWKWPRPFTSTCGNPVRLVQTVRDSSVADQADLPDMHDPRVAARQDLRGLVLGI